MNEFQVGCVVALVAFCLLCALLVLPAFIRSGQISRMEERRTITDAGRAALAALQQAEE